ncbi:hypothetical protein C2I18_03585 [Paenibacillus sp. PK3_47]|uniref:AraC family transcriptional regulator n=1 Tax=Paenibacillus sp. PK3_47 TaxID=2072642 RepID=UPI00201DF35A|nr:helix-turn-helix domain-containing protein [Paenibacillus sp. PK3_47]UQZ32720.1 hypothetical protein C2I18_03585 [Paenibacillus sp. PK3_47]
MTPRMPLSKLEVENSAEMLVPDGCIDIVFRIDRTISDIQAIVVGTLDRAIFVDMEYDQVENLGIRFYPGGLQFFIRESADLFTNHMIDLSEVAKEFANKLMVQLHQASSIEQVLYTLDGILQSRISGHSLWEETFQNALSRIYQTNGNIAVKEIACREAISEKQLTRIFYNRTGVGTKTFCRIIRFQQLLNLLQGNERMTLTDAAILCGYYDQAHFIRDFQDLCHTLPSDYFKYRL